MERKLRGTMTIATDQKPTRSPWGKAIRVNIAANEQTVKGHPQYKAAKAGDNDAAVDLTLGIITAEYMAGVERQIRNSDPFIVPVHALETESVNPIPLAMAEYISAATAHPVNLDILQTNRVSHTGSSGYHRLANPALFDGEVIEGAEYFIVDDFVGQGGTLANLRGFIEQNGGKVVGVSTLTGQRRSAILSVTTGTLEKLRKKHENLEEWWQAVFGYGFELLTESEARYLLRSEDADTIRAGITSATRAGDQRDDAGDD